jgi:hypothetical protein
LATLRKENDVAREPRTEFGKFVKVVEKWGEGALLQARADIKLGRTVVDNDLEPFLAPYAFSSRESFLFAIREALKNVRGRKAVNA